MKILHNFLDIIIPFIIENDVVSIPGLSNRNNHFRFGFSPRQLLQEINLSWFWFKFLNWVPFLQKSIFITSSLWPACYITEEAYLFLSLLLLEFLESYRELWGVVDSDAKWPGTCVSSLCVLLFVHTKTFLWQIRQAFRPLSDNPEYNISALEQQKL